MMTDVIKGSLGKDIIYGRIPEGANIDPDEEKKLYQRVLEETQKTDKAYHRDYEKNEDIAHADTTIYLSVKSLNDKMCLDNKKSDVLMMDYYFLSSSTRVYLCAKELNLGSKLICNPRELISYLAETGNIDKGNIQFTKLFDNPFMAYTAMIVNDDINTLLNSGVDVRGCTIIRMKYEFEEEIQSMLTMSNTDEFMDIYEKVTDKGYSYNKAVTDAIEDRNAGKKQLEQLVNELSDAQKIIESQNKEISKLKYLKRVQKKPLNYKKK